MAPGLFGAVAAEAIIFQDGFDVPVEINPPAGWRRQFGNIHLGCRQTLAEEGRCQAEAELPETEHPVRLQFQ
jgi:hypothetical protein